MNLALMAEGLIGVPLDMRQTPGELTAMLKDCSPALICCMDSELISQIQAILPEAPPGTDARTKIRQSAADEKP